MMWYQKQYTCYLGALALLLQVTCLVDADCSLFYDDKSSSDDIAETHSTIRVAHIGNSVQYYGDLPRLLERVLQETYENVIQGSCLRPASTIRSVFDKGNNMASRFNTTQALLPDGTYDLGYPTVQDMLLDTNMTTIDDKDEAKWDYVIINDRTRHPAAEDTREQSIVKLEDDYVPLLEDSGEPSVVFAMTWAFREPVNGADEFGDFDDFTELLLEGYEEYQKAIKDSMLAPTGLAFQYIRDNYKKTDENVPGGFTWEWLYNEDHFHPSPHGMLLQAFVIYTTIVGMAPPDTYDLSWWDRIRYFQPSGREPQHLPSQQEASILREAACQVVYDYND